MSATTTESKKERAKRIGEWLAAEETRKMAELVDHPNAAISVWRMLPGSNYGAVIKDRKVIGYEVGIHGHRKFMPIEVAKRLVKQGQCKSGMLGDLWIQVSMDWQPKPKKAAGR